MAYKTWSDGEVLYSADLNGNFEMLKPSITKFWGFAGEVTSDTTRYTLTTSGTGTLTFDSGSASLQTGTTSGGLAELDLLFGEVIVDNVPNTVTVEMTFTLSSSTSSNFILLDFYKDASNHVYAQYDGGIPKVYLRSERSGTTTNGTSTDTITLDTESVLKIVLNKTDAKLYLDGSLIDTVTTNIPDDQGLTLIKNQIVTNAASNNGLIIKSVTMTIE